MAERVFHSLYPQLIHDLLQGEELVITEDDHPIAKLTRSPRTSWPCQPGSAKDGYPLSPGHFVPSITYREGLTTLPWQRQLVDL
jgi:antitoxin (DNA-binding transcriptional repressor) of toxin-antitoxin stability system